MVVLDAWALVAFLKREPPAPLIRDAWQREGAAISIINLGEVLYIRSRTHGERDAAERVELVREDLEVVPADWPLVEDATRIKSGGGLSFADAFCVATARRLDAELWTADPEILNIAPRFNCRTRDLRS
ncbi:MAG: type II toxin-antitoxin system VapC family toxin [Solirubrobacterales bacterium]|nr:type II toxin-antitoxin system VapC family toxin [Solirubrobacterales bacterium]